LLCVVAVDSICSDFKAARLLLSHYGFLNLEGLKVAFHVFFFLFALSVLDWSFAVYLYLAGRHLHPVVLRLPHKLA